MIFYHAPLLILFSHIYRIIWSIRKWLYDSGIFKTRRLPSPVICIGNITTGGTGKTPTVIALARLLQGGKYNAAILSRGYKRRSQCPILEVSNGNNILSTPIESGDEPYLIASTIKNIPVIVGADRIRSGRYAADHLGANLFILDDGYQHLKLHRDINILLIDAANPCGNGYLLPKGILREPLSGISRADCIIVTRADEGDKRYVEEMVRLYNHNSPIFCASYKPAGITDLKGNNLGHDYISGKKVLLFAGIANPKSFKKSILNLGGEISKELLYPDHYWYNETDIGHILSEAHRLSIDAVVTTAKDAVRLLTTDDENPLPLRERDRACPDPESSSGVSGVRVGFSDEKIKIVVLHVEMEIDRQCYEWIEEQLAHKGG